MASFGTVALPQFNNSLYDLASIDRDVNANRASQAQVQRLQVDSQLAQQGLADQMTLRGLGAGLAANDPNAQAQAALLPGGAQAINSLAALANQRRTTAAAYGGMAANVAGSVVTQSPDQQPAVYDQLRRQAISQGLPDSYLPSAFPGTNSLNALRLTQIPAAEQFKIFSEYPSTSNAGPFAAPGGVAPPASFTQRMGASEGGSNPAAVNKQGYSGQFQFGAERLNDLDVYHPAFGESLKGNQWRGTFNIPGFPDVRTHEQFLANPTAQRAVFGEHVANIDQAIGQTPGAQRLNQDGLRAVAHLGGVEGMREFVASGGQYDPADANGTHLSDYYRKFAQGGAPALQAEFGHPDGPHAPQQVASAGQPVPLNAPPAAPAPQQIATAAPAIPAQDASNGSIGATEGTTPGQVASIAAQQGVAPPAAGSPSQPASPQTAPQQAAPAPVQVASAAPSVMSDVAGTGQPGAQLLAQNTPMPAPPNALLQAAPQPPPQNSPAPLPAQSIGPAGQGSPYGYTPGGLPNAPPGTKLLSVKGQPLKVDGQPGMALGITPDGQRVAMPLPGAINTGRQIEVKGPGGETQIYAPGGALMRVVPPDRSKVQGDDYEADRKEIQAAPQKVIDAQTSKQEYKEMRDALKQIRTGSGGDNRAAMAAFVKTYVGAASPEAADFLNRIGGMSNPEAAQEFEKLRFQQSSSQERGVLGSNGSAQALEMFAKANPSLNMLNGTNEKIIAMKTIAAQATEDYNQARMDYFNPNAKAYREQGKNYNPLLEFDQQWTRQRNPQVYAAAMSALGGKEVGGPHGWAKGLSETEYERALKIVSRADPSAVVNGKSGKLSMQPPDAQGVEQKQAGAPPPAIGFVDGGYRYKGGDPHFPTSWEQVR